MVEYHGWFSVNQSTNGNNEDNITSIADEIKKAVAEIASENVILIFKPINGTYFLHLAGHTNHRSEDIEEVLSLINLISAIAKGSYGTLYLRDDENSNGKNNEFVIYKLAKGEITIEKDQLLSPCNPTIED